MAHWLQQLLTFNPLFLVPAVAGMLALSKDRRFGALVYAAVAVELLFFAAGGKAYYPAPIYPIAYAAGAMWLDSKLTSTWRVAAFGVPSILLILVLLPIGLPVYPVQTMVDMKLYQARNDYAHMIGWPELAQETAQLYDSLPADQRANAMIVTHYYGEAGAIDYYGPALGLPHAVSPHLTYWYWAPARMNPSTVVMINFTLDEGNRLFTDCRQVGVVSNSYGIQNDDSGAPILVCTNPRRPLWQVWGSLQTLG